MNDNLTLLKDSTKTVFKFIGIGAGISMLMVVCLIIMVFLMYSCASSVSNSMKTVNNKPFVPIDFEKLDREYGTPFTYAEDFDTNYRQGTERYKNDYRNSQNE